MKDPQLPWDALAPGEQELTSPTALMQRQVHPRRLVNGKVTSETFRPGRSDHGQLSCTQADVVTAQDALTAHVARGLESAGCALFTIGEVWSPTPLPGKVTACPALRMVDDAHGPHGTDLPEGHAYVDFRPVGSKAIERKAKQMAFFANKRGLFIPA